MENTKLDAVDAEEEVMALRTGRRSPLLGGCFSSEEVPLLAVGAVVEVSSVPGGASALRRSHTSTVQGP